ncbi:molybdenum cofactor guanylyltransferase MobA [Sulfurimonas sp.]|uniref:molybdenum cofactor guanylyltransferase MobA n=1 Tax=Sulfurimonas sp. TaxID=2022749 RepID=UPI003D0E9F8C
MLLDIPCIIFAGGKSSRMGEDKALLPFADFPTLTHYQLNRLSKIFHSVYISCKSKEKFDFQANFIEDTNKELFAPTAAFISIFSHLNVDKVFVISVDTPFIDTEIFTYLIKNDINQYDATVAIVDDEIQPLCGIYHRSLLERFLEMEKNDTHKLHYLLKNSNVNFVNFEDKEKFLNLNNQEEYQQALQKLK